MVKDHENKKDKNKIIEVFVDGVWVPAMATELRIINRDLEVKKVEEIRVRKL